MTACCITKSPGKGGRAVEAQIINYAPCNRKFGRGRKTQKKVRGSASPKTKKKAPILTRGGNSNLIYLVQLFPSTELQCIRYVFYCHSHPLCNQQNLHADSDTGTVQVPPYGTAHEFRSRRPIISTPREVA